jgi:hypothetical protein
MIYGCENCGADLPPGVLACPNCGHAFDEKVPQDAEVRKKGWIAKQDEIVSDSATVMPTPSSLPVEIPITAETPERYPDYILPEDLPRKSSLPKPASNIPKSISKKPDDAGFSGMGCVALFLVCAFLFCYVMYKLNPEDPTDVAKQHQADVQQAQEQKKQDDEQKTQDNEVTDLGGEGILTGAPLEKGGQSDTVILAQSKDDFEAFSKANAAGDNYGINNLVTSGRVFSIQSGQVRAKMLDSDWTGDVQVRILSGEHQGEADWTYMECLQKP